jgi:hypothetical protein
VEGELDFRRGDGGAEIRQSLDGCLGRQDRIVGVRKSRHRERRLAGEREDIGVGREGARAADRRGLGLGRRDSPTFGGGALAFLSKAMPKACSFSLADFAQASMVAFSLWTILATMIEFFSGEIISTPSDRFSIFQPAGISMATSGWFGGNFISSARTAPAARPATPSDAVTTACRPQFSKIERLVPFMSAVTSKVE